MRRRVGIRPAGSVEALAEGCRASFQEIYKSIRDEADPEAACSAALKYVIQLLATLLAAHRIPGPHPAANALRRATNALLDQPDYLKYRDAYADAHLITGLNIFRQPDVAKLDSETLASAIHLLLHSNNSPVEPIFFETMPLTWLGRIYQVLLTFKPDETTLDLTSSHSGRKKSGTYFTPPSLINYITGCVLRPLLESHGGLLGDSGEPLRVLDPSMGSGDFLGSVVDFLSENAGSATRAKIAAECVFGVDNDPYAVDIARFSVWVCSGFAEGIICSLNSHLLCADTLEDENYSGLDWKAAFGDVIDTGGFDAVIGNPPYIASKNGLPAGRAIGQSDYYLMFVTEVLDKKLVRSGGYFSMVLPDPLLVRENAAEVRRRLITEWSLVSLLHISGAFPDAVVANVVPICRNVPSSAPTFSAARIDRMAEHKSFLTRSCETFAESAHEVRTSTVLAQKRCEFLYLLEQGSFANIVKRIHGPDIALSNYTEPFAPLHKLNVKTIYRGEEVGKTAIMAQDGDQKVLLGGQSIQPYETTWEGNTAATSWVRKPLYRYHSTKILVQKSSPRIVAALDRVSKRHTGYVFPQSVYAIELAEPGMDPLYLLCLLNSNVLNEYIRCTVTGYKLHQPQLEIEDIRALPIRRVNFTTPTTVRESDLAKGIDIFERESLRVGEFPELANFVSACLAGWPEKSDVVHDLLVYLGREVTTLIRTGRRRPDAEVTRRLQVTRSAIEAVVWRLYSSEPAQMALPW
ncbi:MAG: Eco57I restriction-modification methylase domain-containing protein [Armatimonadota bacterium]